MGYFAELDLHGLTAEQGKQRLNDYLKHIPTDVRELTVIHGFHGGTALRDMVRRFQHPRLERKVLGLNQGSTIFILKQK